MFKWFWAILSLGAPEQSSQYDTFLSRALDQCFTCVAKMRRNTVTLDDGNWTIANLETCSFIRFNNAFRKNLLQAAKGKTRKLTDHRKQLLSRALISSRLVLSHEYENCWKWSPVVMFKVGPGEGDEERCRQHYKHMYGVKTCEVFLCFLVFIFLGSIVLASQWLLCFHCFTLPSVSFKGFYTEDAPDLMPTAAC